MVLRENRSRSVPALCAALRCPQSRLARGESC